MLPTQNAADLLFVRSSWNSEYILSQRQCKQETMQTGDSSQVANKSHSLLRTQWKASGGMTAMALAPGGSHEARKGEDSFPQGSFPDAVSGKISTIHLSAPPPTYQ